jgi:hypothetical protein
MDQEVSSMEERFVKMKTSLSKQVADLEEIGKMRASEIEKLKSEKSNKA